MVAPRIVFMFGFIGWFFLSPSLAVATNPATLGFSEGTVISLASGTIDPEFQALIHLLEESRIGQMKTSQENAAILQLIAMGDSSVESVVDAYRHNTDDYTNLRIYIIEILEGIKTPKSRQILFDMAMDRNGLGSIYSWRAGMAYMRCVKDKKEIAKLLESPNLNSIHGEILRAIKGVDVDDKLLGYLNPWLTGPSFYLRLDSLSLLDADPSPEKADDKLQGIIQSMLTIEKMQIPLGDSTAKVYDRYQYNYPGTYADVLFEAATNALIQVKAPKQIFAEQTDSLSGMPRFWAMAARANRGDASIHDELKTIVSDPNLFPRMRLRQLGVQAFSKIGTPVDIPWLKRIADSDLYRIHLYLSSSRMFEWVNETMVNNTGPRAPMLPEEPPTPRSMSVLYPIRSAAKDTIYALDARRAEFESTVKTENIQRLIERIQQLAYCEEPSPEVERDPQAISLYYPNQFKQREKSKPERLRLEAELVAFGDQAVDPIVQKLFTVIP